LLTLLVKVLDIKSSPSLGRNIDSFEDRQYWAFFNTTKENLHILYQELLFDDDILLEDGIRMPGEEVI
jgi:hypothetical protein